ncbi:nitroreductase family deazaflavin-dependent oxidoreductase [Mycolicibacterium septicum]|uniref:nitroreductase family deazaflavin-dependent oxidoreductase n=1 Tax=Mycolicibacterium septicum TaxID=98668 RepID=UPI0023E0F79D|nr:nitroreductase family deazaflavin-dependent oxidoreductase [Mycolicibacterium septicum]MDF3341162.1 nitroreductase family deazaflavin-dependent oxidoreductase [Mycolicibacterium septicum]
MSNDSLSGIPRVELDSRPLWKRQLFWLIGGKLFTTERAAGFWRRRIAPLEAPVIKATRGRARMSFSIPVLVLTSTGARSGKRYETPLAYFTDGDDVVLIASNYGREHHPSWYHNLLAHPACELHIGPRGGRFVAREATGADRDRLYALAADRLNKGWNVYEQRTDGIRTIPVLRLSPDGRA